MWCVVKPSSADSGTRRTTISPPVPSMSSSTNFANSLPTNPVSNSKLSEASAFSSCVRLDGLYSMFLVNHLVGAAGNLQGLRVFLDVGVDVANTLLLEDFFDSNQNTRLLYVAEAIVDGRAEEFHGG